MDEIEQRVTPPASETPEERRRRLANQRAAKYRRLKSLDDAEDKARRDENNRRQRERRRTLDESARTRARELNRARQQLRRRTLSEDSRQEIRDKQRERQRARRTQLDHEAREALRERERLRVRTRRAREAEARSSQTSSPSSGPPLPPPHMLSASRSALASHPPPALIARDARTAISANGVLNSPELLPQMPTAALQLPPVLASSSSSYTHGRLDTELPNLQPHLRPIQQLQQPPPPHAQPLQVAYASLASFQFSSLPSAFASQSSLQASAFADRIPQLPHLQMALPQASALLSAPPPPSLMFQLAPPPPQPPSMSSMAPVPSGLPGISVAASVPHSSPSLSMLSAATASSATSGLLPPTQQQQMLPSIAIPPPVRALPPLPDFLNNREPFAASSSASSYFPIFVDHSHSYQDDTDAVFRTY